jgi:hypothetical protein
MKISVIAARRAVARQGIFLFSQVLLEMIFEHFYVVMAAAGV